MQKITMPKVLPAGNAAAAAVVLTRDTTPALRLFARFGLVCATPNLLALFVDEREQI